MNGKTKIKLQEKAEIVTAAEALDHALAQYDTLISDVEKTPLTSKKGIERAARTTQEATQIGETMGQLVATLAQAIQTMSARQSERSMALIERSREIKRRFDEMVALSQRFDELATESNAVNEEVQLHGQKELTTDADKAEFLRGLAARMVPLIGRAKELAVASRDAEFPDMEKNADSLAQTLASAKNKVELVARRLG